MPIKTDLSRPVAGYFILLALVAISLLFLLFPIVFFAGITLSFTTVVMMAIVCLYGLKESFFAAAIVYGAAVPIGAMNIRMAIIHIAAIVFISAITRRRLERLIPCTMLYWLIIAAPVMAVCDMIIYGYMDRIGIFIIQKEITFKLFASLLVDILMTYTPLRQIGINGRIKTAGLQFSRIMVHTSLAAITIPYFIYIGLTGYSNHKEIAVITDNMLLSNQNIMASYLNNRTDNELFALSHQGVVEISLFNQELQHILTDTGTEIVVTDNMNIVIGSNISAAAGSYFDWRIGGRVLPGYKDAFYWIPDGNFRNETEKWSNAYIINEKEIPEMRLKLIMMKPYRSYLAEILGVYVFQFWVYLFFCLALILLGFLFKKTFFGPLKRLAETTTGIPARLAQGNLIEWHKSGIVEIDTLVDNFKTVTDDLEGMFERTHRMAYYDSLTGLPNRLSMQDALSTLFCSHQDVRTFALLFFDLDRFKQVNDSLGHAVGDRLLQEIAARLKSIESESVDVYRVSGDEFVIIAQGMGQEAAERTAQYVLDLMSQPVWVDEHELHITSSVGIALYPQHGDDSETLMRFADASMYTAKEGGRNTYALYTESLQKRLDEQLWLEHQLRKALELNQLTLYYQAIVDGSTYGINGMEALIRWNHPEKGFISPVQFIPVAEQSGLIIPIGQWVLEQACIQNKRWQDAGFPKVRMAVNLSARQFYSGHIKEDVRSILEETGLEPGCLELEITEGFMIKDPEYVAIILEELKMMGVTVSIDDFGTGYSSLGRLKHFSVNAVKIDRSLVRNVGEDPDNSSIVRAVIELAHGMNLKVIAEGIETEEEISFLTRYGCDEMQGFYFTRPMDAESFTQRWRQMIDRPTK